VRGETTRGWVLAEKKICMTHLTYLPLPVDKQDSRFEPRERVRVCWSFQFSSDMRTNKYGSIPLVACSQPPFCILHSEYFLTIRITSHTKIPNESNCMTGRRSSFTRLANKSLFKKSHSLIVIRFSGAPSKTSMHLRYPPFFLGCTPLDDLYNVAYEISSFPGDISERD